MSRPFNLIDYQHLAGFWNRMADIDEQIREAHAEGYMVDVDRLLCERAVWQRQRDELLGARASIESEAA